MEAIQWFITNMLSFLTLLNSYTFAGVSLLGILLGCIILSMVITIFWKGAQG